MDLYELDVIRTAHSRTDLRFAPGEVPLSGGTWLFSEAQPDIRGMVDLTALGWEPITLGETTLGIAGTCTFAELAELTPPELRAAAPGSPFGHRGAVGGRAVGDQVAGGCVTGAGATGESTPSGNSTLGDPSIGRVLSAAIAPEAHPLFWQCATALLGSEKIWRFATVGGNIALSLAAAPMTALGAALDAEALIWTPDGGERRHPVASLVTGNHQNSLAHGEVLRSIEIPLSALTARSGFRRIALSPLGRSGTVVIARVDDSGEAVFTITAGTPRPRQFRFDEVPSARALRNTVLGIDEWFSDPHGAPDWRRAMSALLAEQLRIELGGAA
ncbi:MAG: FAD binding domain-containing protein [Microbacteriaceae bacterium]|nr:FAD binding domain-containing protein [Microbacteriaceae bacterium]